MFPNVVSIVSASGLCWGLRLCVKKSKSFRTQEISSENGHSDFQKCLTRTLRYFFHCRGNSLCNLNLPWAEVLCLCRLCPCPLAEHPGRLPWSCARPEKHRRIRRIMWFWYMQFLSSFQPRFFSVYSSELRICMNLLVCDKWVGRGLKCYPNHLLSW